MGESKSQQNLSYGQPVVEPDFSASVSCPRCNDTGYVMDSGHDDECDGYTCSPNCPVPVQSLCPDCGFKDQDAPCEFGCDQGWLANDEGLEPPDGCIGPWPLPNDFHSWVRPALACVCSVDVRGLAV